MPEDVLAEHGRYQSKTDETLNATDPPQHTRLRKLMQPAFTPRRVERFEPKIRELADRLLDPVIDDRRMNIGSAYATPLISRVIAFILGLDPLQPEVAKFGEWMDSRFTIEVRPDLPAEEADRHWRNVLAWESFMADFVERNREERGDNLTTDMMDARSDEGEPVMSDSELMSNVIGIQGAGSDSTANLIGLTLNLLLRDRGRWDAVVADPTLIPKAIEESLRHNGPVRGVARRVLKDVRIGGVDIPAGSKLFLSIASANRDEEHFDDPDAIDIQRPNAREHLGFGLRTHFCVGAPLARAEARIAIERLVERIPTLRLARPDEEIWYTENFSVPGVRGLDVEWG
jgi:cytochrome P450